MKKIIELNKYTLVELGDDIVPGATDSDKEYGALGGALISRAELVIPLDAQEHLPKIADSICVAARAVRKILGNAEGLRLDVLVSETAPGMTAEGERNNCAMWNSHRARTLQFIISNNVSKNTGALNGVESLWQNVCTAVNENLSSVGNRRYELINERMQMKLDCGYSDFTNCWRARKNILFEFNLDEIRADDSPPRCAISSA